MSSTGDINISGMVLNFQVLTVARRIQTKVNYKQDELKIKQVKESKLQYSKKNSKKDEYRSLSDGIIVHWLESWNGEA